MNKMLLAGIAAIFAPAAWSSAAFGASSVVNGAMGPAVRTAGGDRIADEPEKKIFKPAAESAPDSLLNAATRVVLASLRQDLNLRRNNPAKFAEVVDSTILPLFDFRHMTRLAMARNWRLASLEQQGVLVGEFKTLLVRTYSSALSNYRDEVITYVPLRMAPGETDVRVRSTVKQRKAERLTIDYDMEKTADGWKVYDIKIAGVSLITTYRSTFADIVGERGIDGLIHSLSAKNRQAEAAPG